MKWPNNKKFAFTIIDDTDNAVLNNIQPVYDLLKELQIKSTKTVWVYPPRDDHKGDCLQDAEYLEFIRNLISEGYEIAMHGVGSGSFSSEEISKGLDEFKQLLGDNPTMHVNHSRNPDNIYWGNRRFVFPLSWLLALSSRRRKLYQGEIESSPHFWGDRSKKYIKYQRNHVFNGINTLLYDPIMPTRTKEKNKYSNYWFSSSDGHTLAEFNALMSRKNIDALENSGGCCIVYTHFASGFVKSDGSLDEDFQSAMKYLKSKDGWFVPASEILDHLSNQKKRDGFASYLYLLGLDMKWIRQRIIKRLKFGH